MAAALQFHVLESVFGALFLARSFVSLLFVILGLGNSNLYCLLSALYGTSKVDENDGYGILEEEQSQLFGVNALDEESAIDEDLQVFGKATHNFLKEIDHLCKFKEKKKRKKKKH